MRKLQHQNSCHVAALQTSDSPESGQLQQTELACSQREARGLEGKILLLEERGKGIQQFYENKLAQLRTVLVRQGEARNELLLELQRLTAEGVKQQRYVGQLKGRLEQERVTTSQRLRPSLLQPAAEKYAVKRNSRSKPGLLFNSKDLAATPAHRPTLKKCRSEQYLESEYFATDAQGRSEKSIPSLNNPEKPRGRGQQ